jgi:hypothetical protein
MDQGGKGLLVEPSDGILACDRGTGEPGWGSAIYCTPWGRPAFTLTKCESPQATMCRAATPSSRISIV